MPEIHSSEGVRKFIFVGRYERRKGVEELTSVLSELATKNNFELTFVGEIPEKKKISLPSIKYLGKITDSETMKSVLRNSDVLVCPSYSEGMPNVILEAMGSGLAIIASDVGAVNRLVSQKNGWLTSAGDKKELRSAIMAGIEIPSKEMDQMKINSKTDAGNYLWENVITQLIGEIQGVC